MNKLFLSLVPSVLVATSAFAAAECERLPAPELNYKPGMELEKVVAMQASVKEFVASGEAYLKCIDEQRAAAGEEATEEQLATWVALYNGAVDEIKIAAEEFNVIVREYKASQGE